MVRSGPRPVGQIAEELGLSHMVLDTATTATAPASECFTVRDGKIAENVLVFDRLSFTPADEP